MSIRDSNKKLVINDITDDIQAINYNDINKVFIELEYRDFILLKSIKTYLNKGYEEIYLH